MLRGVLSAGEILTTDYADYSDFELGALAVIFVSAEEPRKNATQLS